MKSQVEKWLAERREKEPRLEVSICWWVEMDRQRTRPKRPKRDRAEGQKISMYFSDEMYSEIREDAQRHGRTISRTVQTAWLMAREAIMRYPAAP